MVDGSNWLKGRPASKSLCGFSLLALFFFLQALRDVLLGPDGYEKWNVCAAPSRNGNKYETVVSW